MNYHSPVALGNILNFGPDNEQYQVTHVSMTTEYSFVYAVLDDENGNTIRDLAITALSSKMPHHYCPAWYSVGSLFLNNETGKWYMVTQINYYIEPFTKEKNITYLMRNSVGDFRQLREDVLRKMVADQKMEFIITRGKSSKPYEWDKENSDLAKQLQQEPMWYHDYQKEGRGE